MLSRKSESNLRVKTRIKQEKSISSRIFYRAPQLICLEKEHILRRNKHKQNHSMNGISSEQLIIVPAVIP